MEEYRLTEKIEEEIYMGRDKDGISYRIGTILIFWRKKIAITQSAFLKKQSFTVFCKRENSRFWKHKCADFAEPNGLQNYVLCKTGVKPLWTVYPNGPIVPWVGCLHLEDCNSNNYWFLFAIVANAHGSSHTFLGNS